MMLIKVITRGVKGIPGYFKKLFSEGCEFLSSGVGEAALLIGLFLKHLRVREKFTLQELREMRRHFNNVLKMVYAVSIFLLPGGLVVLSFVYGAMHKRH